MLMERYPPLLSVMGGQPYITEGVIIYDSADPSKVWLHVKKGDPHYNWMFTAPFQPSGSTHFIVADLEALAKATPLKHS